MIFAGIGKSKSQNPFEAGREACKEAQVELKEEADLVFLFSSIKSNQKKLLEGARSIFKNTPIVGASSTGEIILEGVISEDTVAMALKTPQLNWSIEIGRNANKDSFLAGKTLAEEIKAKAKNSPSLILVFMDGFSENPALAIKGIQEVFGKNFPIIGGVAGDNFCFKKTFEYFNQEILSGAIIGIGISGKISFGFGSGHGLKPIGLPMKVTRSVGKEVIEIDDQPAFSIYEKFFEKKAQELIEKPFSKVALHYPLGIILEKNKFLIRNPIRATEDGRIIFLGEVPEGSMVRLMINDTEKALKAARKAAENAIFELKGKAPKFGFIFESAIRKKVLSEIKKEEIDILHRIIGEKKLIGLYGYGEIELLRRSSHENQVLFQNGSISLITFGE